MRKEVKPDNGAAVAPGAGYMNEIDDATFEQAVLKRLKPVLLYFWASTCKPCKIMKPDIEEIENDLGDEIEFVNTDAVANDGICQKYGVLSTPTVIMFHHGEPVMRVIGYVTRQDLRSRIEEQLKTLS